MKCFSTVVEITRSSVRVLQRHRRLLAFPLLSLMVSLTAAAILLPWLGDDDATRSGLGLFLLFFVFELTSHFFSAALTAEALRALRGQQTSVAGGLGCAAAHGKAVAGLAGIAATVGTVASWFGSGRGRASRLMGQLVGGAWQSVSYLALPVMIAERRGSYDSLVRSGRLLRQTWGETAIAELGLRVITVHLVLITIVLCAILAEILEEPLVLAIAICFLLACMVVLSALQAIYRAALYIFAAEGVLPGDFDTPAMNEVWRVK